MRLKNTAFVYNVTVQGSSNSDWGTELGQSNKHTFTLEGFPEFLNAMMYYKIDDVDNIKVILGKGNRTLKPFSAYSDVQLVLASCFNKVYLNDKLLDGQRFISYILKEVNTHTAKGEINKHNGRCTLKFSNSLEYNGESVNQKCIDAISEAFGQSKNGSWAILEMSIKNEDELHLYGFALGDSPKNYNSKEERNSDFERYLNDDDIEYRRAAFKAYLFAPGTFKSKSTAPLYWKHVSEPQFKNRISFVWEILSSIVGYQTEDLLVIDSVEVANKLKDIVTPDQRNKDYGNQLASAIIKNYIEFLENRKTILKDNRRDAIEVPLALDAPLQKIFYGAPGTGKSFKTNEIAKKYSTIRTTFHPDSDYSTFVGAYKPTTTTEDRYGLNGSNTVALRYPEGMHNGETIKENKIEYRFVKQSFMKAYINAWKLFCKAENNNIAPQFLVIEEINRGNCAQIFGDLFQLLDRKNGYSEYPIDADEDIHKCLLREDSEDDPSFGTKGLQLTEEQKDAINAIYNSDDIPFRDVAEEIAHGKILVLPPNLYIWATMNTSDQSLFPIDSAFKRRWDWEYIPISYKNSNWTIQIGEKQYNWVDFQKKINENIYAVDNSEDKLLGDYFVNADRTGCRISADTLLNKILFYIWNDVCKDDPDQIFKWNNGKQEESIKFSDFFGPDRDKKLQGFMEFHKISAIGETADKDNFEEIVDSEGAETDEIPAEDDNEVNA